MSLKEEIFSRNRLVFGDENQKKIDEALVFVFGLGGVGGYAVENLARAGVGNIGLVDFDTFELTNLNRQNYSNVNNIGKKKINVIKKELSRINPSLNIISLDRFVRDDYGFLLEWEKFHVIDAIDAFRPKLNLIKFCRTHDVSFISCLGAGGRINPQSLVIDDIFNSRGCPLARRLRKFLRRGGIREGVPSIYSNETPVESIPPSMEEKQNHDYSKGRIRNTIGSVPFVPATMGIYSAYYIVKKIVEFNG